MRSRVSEYVSSRDFLVALRSMYTNKNKSPKRTPHSESGFTLQTLIITAVVVVIAIGVGLLFIALTSSSSEDLEDAGRSGIEGSCAPHELLDTVYVRRGIGGPNSQGGVQSQAVGCKPHCATWEFVATPSAGGEYKLGGTGEGSPIGGPEGKGGVFSSNIGCFAPCYWEISNASHHFSEPKELIGIDIERDGQNILDQTTDSRLRYYNDNRAPAVGQVRLGVTYRRADDAGTTNQSYESSDLWPDIRVPPGLSPWKSSNDGKAYIFIRRFGGRFDAGAGRYEGTPLTDEMINAVRPEDRVPTVNTPNWRSQGNDPLAARNVREWGRFNTRWEDEDWEIRADPKNEVCEIIYTPTDRLICSSDNNSCLESNKADSECPQTLDSRDHRFKGTPVCRIP